MRCSTLFKQNKIVRGYTLSCFISLLVNMMVTDSAGFCVANVHKEEPIEKRVKSVIQSESKVSDCACDECDEKSPSARLCQLKDLQTGQYKHLALPTTPEVQSPDFKGFEAPAISLDLAIPKRKIWFPLQKTWLQSTILFEGDAMDREEDSIKALLQSHYHRMQLCYYTACEMLVLCQNDHPYHDRYYGQLAERLLQQMEKFAEIYRLFGEVSQA